MICDCECCDRKDVPVARANVPGEPMACFICQGDNNPDPYGELETTMQTHFQSPCIHCGKPMEDVPVGACPGDASRAIPVAYRSLGVRWDGYEHFLVRLSTNEVVEHWCHTSMQAPYRGFNMLGDIQTPPRYDSKLTTSSS